MTFTEAAAEVLRLAGKPLHYKEITELAIEKNLLSHVGKSPEVTMGARLAALLKKEDKTNPIVRVKPGVFALREWDGKRGKKGKSEPVAEAEVDAEVSDVSEETESAGDEINALEVEAATRESVPPPPATPPAVLSAPEEEDEDDRPIVSGEDALRAEMAAQGAELFDDEEDDDQPIFAPQNAPPAQVGEPLTEGGRRRRRRRRRGRGGSGATDITADGTSSPRLEGAGSQQPNSSRFDPGVGTTPRFDPALAAAVLGGEENGAADVQRDPLAPAPRPQVRDRHQIMAGGAPSGIEVPIGEGEELFGKDLADAALIVMASFDRNAGPVPLRAIVDAFMRRGRLSGDPSLAVIQVGAALRADNLRRSAAGQRPRFRFAAGSRVAPTDWILGSDLVRLEQEVNNAIERYREATRRVLLRRIQELPGHAFTELALLALERSGMSQIRPVRRAGSPGGEAHFSAVHRTGTDEIRTALVIRKDGRELGRERVSDLRGALHHYGPAVAGWLITTGQVLSGAREEAGAPNAAPVALYDGLAFCKLLEEGDVGVVRTRFSIAIPDLELFETLRG